MLGRSVTFGTKSVEKRPQQENFFELTSPTRQGPKVKCFRRIINYIIDYRFSLNVMILFLGNIRFFLISNEGSDLKLAHRNNIEARVKPNIFGHE